MLIREANAPFEKHAVMHYGVDGCKPVRHYYEMQPIGGVLYKGREYDEYGTMVCDLYTIYPETNVGLIARKGLRLYCNKAPNIGEEEVRRLQSWYDENATSEALLDALKDGGCDSLENYLATLKRLVADGKWIGNLEIAYVGLVDAAFSQELSDYRQKYQERQEEKRAERRAQKEAEHNAYVKEQNDKTDTAIQEALEVIRHGGTVTNSEIVILKDYYDSHKYMLVNYLCRKYNLNVPLRTQGWIANKLTSFEVSDGHLETIRWWRNKNSDKPSDKAIDYLAQLIKAVRAETEDQIVDNT